MKTFKDVEREITCFSKNEKQEIKNIAYLTTEIIKQCDILGLSAKELSIEAGIDEKELTKFETKGEISLKNFIKICMALNLKIKLIENNQTSKTDDCTK